MISGTDVETRTDATKTWYSFNDRCTSPAPRCAGHEPHLAMSLVHARLDLSTAVVGGVPVGRALSGTVFDRDVEAEPPRTGSRRSRTGPGPQGLRPATLR